MKHLVSIVTFAPAAGALALAFVGAGRTRAIRSIACAAATVTLLAAILLWVGFQPRGAEWQFATELDWFSAAGPNYSVGTDGLGVLFLLLTAVAGWIAVVWSTVDVHARVKEHAASMLMLQTGLAGAFASLDVVQLCLFWLVSLASMWVLAGIRDAGPRARTARRAAVFTAAGSAAVMLGIALLCVHAHSVTGVWTFDLQTLRHLNFPPLYQAAAFLLMVSGAAATAGLVPFHGWLRDAILEAPPAVAMLLAVSVVKLATYAVLRVELPVLPDASRSFALAIMVLAGVSTAFGVAMASAQSEPRKTIAYVNLAQAGLIFLAAFALTPAALTISAVVQVGYAVMMVAAFFAIPRLPRLARVVAVLAGTGLVSAALYSTLHPTLETSIARIVLRVSPERAAEVADCLANAQAPPPVPTDPALPAGMFVAAPCADGESTPKSPGSDVPK
jgi:NADH-quinone oxidoreductase subunit M